jgi:AAA15 family ATPase/GTPase
MQIKTLKYKQFENIDRYWNLQEINFEKINLLVGKNTSGKSKTLNVIYNLFNILGENRPLSFAEGDYDIVFQHDNTIYRYNILISRNSEGKGRTIYPYLEDIYFWANHIRLFQFGGFAGKNTDNGVLSTFNSGIKKYPKIFTDKVIKDFNSIGFNIEDIDLCSIASVSFQIIENPNAQISAIKVKEKDLSCWTDQWDMSNGMFRALSIIIHFNYYELENIPCVILIDDIGEGLDFERSSKLIELLVSKVEKNENMQLIMTTNNSFVMNSVDLKYWQIIDREGCKVKYYNQNNSPKTFADYKFTGLNHFDFFASGFFKNGFF